MSEENEQLISTPGKFGENFLLERELGRGGMGGVYLGRDVMLDRPVAVKVILKQYGEDEEFLSKFRTEAQAAAKLIHPNIAQIYSYGVTSGMPYIAMELVAGGSLQQVMDNAPDGKTDIPRVLKICEQVAQALRCAADQGLVHGDIKPDNILLDANGNAKLVDFGLAGMQKDTDEIWGTPYYIAPEKLKKEVVDYRADMYNLGGTLYHALTGVAPFEGEDANAVVRKRFEGRPAKPSSLRPEITPAVDKLVMKMLELKREDRFPTFEALLQSFQQVLSTGLSTATAQNTKGGKKSGGHKMLMRSKRHATSIKLGGAKPSSGGSESGASSGDWQSTVATPAGTPGINLGDVAADQEEDENENVGKKFLIMIGSGIGAIALLAGGIAWYVVADRKSRAAETQAAIVKNIGDARQAISDTARIAAKFGDDFSEFSKKATIECEKATKLISEVVPEVAGRLKPDISAELLAAIQLTNTPVVAAVPAGTNDVAGATNAVATAVAEPAPAVPEKKEVAKAEEPENDADLGSSNDPLEKLKIQLKKSERKYQRELRQVADDAVTDVNEIWNLAYGCEASNIRIQLEVQKVLAAAEKATNYVEETEACMTALGTLSGEVKELYDAVKASKDVENVTKGIGIIKSKAAKVQKQTNDNLFRRRAEHEREVKKIKYDIEKLEKEKGEIEAHKKLVATECDEIKTRFDAIQQSKNFELLEWDASLKQLEFVKSNFKTAEGALAADDQMKKVKVMKFVQEVFVRSGKGFQFKKAKLGKLKASIVDADMKEMKLAVADGTKTRNIKLNWVRFYKEYHANLNELIIYYIENGRKNGTPKLTLAEWGDAMCGAALSLRIICADDATAATRGEQIAKDVSKKFPNYAKTLRMMFPDLQFEDAPEE